MKKVLVLFGCLALSCPVGFAMTVEQQSSLGVLEREGFSDSALQLVDLVKYRNGAKRVYRYNKGRIGAYSRMKIYLDPTQDDGQFGEHQINFTNCWNDDHNRYSTLLKKDQYVEDL